MQQRQTQVLNTTALAQVLKVHGQHERAVRASQRAEEVKAIWLKQELCELLDEVHTHVIGFVRLRAKVALPGRRRSVLALVQREALHWALRSARQRAPRIAKFS